MINSVKYLYILLALLLVSCSCQAYGAALNTLYNHYARVVVSGAMVSGNSTITNFALLLDVDANTELPSDGNGGNILSGGNDIVFAPQETSDEMEVLKHSIESYNASTGELIVWVKIDLNATSNTEFYMFYGRTGIAVDPSDASLWSDANYIGVWQLSETPGTNAVVDATGNSANGSAIGNVVTDASSVVGLGYSFDGSGDYVSIPENTTIEPSGDFTISCWFKSIGGQNDYAKMFAKGSTSAPYASYTLEMRSDGVGFDNEVGFQTGRTDGNYVLTDTNGNGFDDIKDGEWYYFVGTIDTETSSVTQASYLNGNLIETDNTNSNGIEYYGTAYNLIVGGVYDGGISNEFSGTIDELRIANVARSEDFILTERNNVSCGSAFITVENVGLNCNAISVLPIKLKEFSAEWSDDEVWLTWTTYSETNNDYFTVERSKDGKIFEEVDRMSGAGSSKVTQHYRAIDKNPHPGLAYYRLKQTDFDGKYSYSKLIALYHGKVSTSFLKLYPNPNFDIVHIKAQGLHDRDLEIRITDMAGLLKGTYKVKSDAGVLDERIDLNHLAPGSYIISIHGSTTIMNERILII